MKSVRYIYWQDDDLWLGYMQDYPDYMSQGESIDDLEQNLKDVFKELTGGQIPCVRRVGQFSIT